MQDVIIKYILDAIFAAIPAVGFAMVFNVPKFALKFCALGGAIVYTLRSIFMDLGIYIEISTFLASLLFGTLAVYWSRNILFQDLFIQLLQLFL